MLPSERGNNIRKELARIEQATFYRVMDELHQGYKEIGTPITCIIHGNASGADALAAQWAKLNLVPIESYPADWGTYGKAAGPLRNKRMLVEGRPDVAVACPGGAGTRNMRELIEADGHLQIVEVV